MCVCVWLRRTHLPPRGVDLVDQSHLHLALIHVLARPDVVHDVELDLARAGMSERWGACVRVRREESRESGFRADAEQGETSHLLTMRAWMRLVTACRASLPKRGAFMYALNASRRFSSVV